MRARVWIARSAHAGGAAVSASTASSYGRILGANDRINIGFLENLVSLLVGRFEADKIDLLKKHFDWFTSKYIIFNKPSLNRKEQYTYPLYNRYKDIIWK